MSTGRVKNIKRALYQELGKKKTTFRRNLDKLFGEETPKRLRLESPLSFRTLSALSHLEDIGLRRLLNRRKLLIFHCSKKEFSQKENHELYCRMISVLQGLDPSLPLQLSRTEQIPCFWVGEPTLSTSEFVVVLHSKKLYAPPVQTKQSYEKFVQASFDSLIKRILEERAAAHSLLNIGISPIQ